MKGHTTNSIVQLKSEAIEMPPAFSKVELLSVAEIEKRRQARKTKSIKK